MIGFDGADPEIGIRGFGFIRYLFSFAPPFLGRIFIYTSVQKRLEIVRHVKASLYFFNIGLARVEASARIGKSVFLG